jgi:hypothetical protein
VSVTSTVLVKRSTAEHRFPDSLHAWQLRWFDAAAFGLVVGVQHACRHEAVPIPVLTDDGDTGTCSSIALACGSAVYTKKRAGRPAMHILNYSHTYHTYPLATKRACTQTVSC